MSALGPGLDRSAAPEVRHRVLALLAALPAGASATPTPYWPASAGNAPPAAAGSPHRPSSNPHRPGGPPHPAGQADDLRARVARWTLSEAESLGVTGRGALSSHGRALLGLPHEAVATAELPATPGDKLPAHHVPLPHHPGPPPPPTPSPSRPRPPPGPPGCSRRCSPSRWTTSCCRRT